MTSRVLAPASFALGAYAERKGYVEAALETARSLDPNLRRGLDALFGARVAVESAEEVVQSVVDVGASAGAVVASGARDWFGGLAGRARDASVGALGGGRAVVKTDGGLKGTSVMSARGVFLVGALTGFVVVYAYGPERCMAAARRAARRVKEACDDTLERMMVVLERAFSVETRMAIEGALVNAGRAIEPVLKSSQENLLALLEQSKGATSEVAGKISKVAVDVREKYLVVAIDAVSTRAKESYVVVLDAAGLAKTRMAPFVESARRRAREFVAGVVDVIKASLKSQ